MGLFLRTCDLWMSYWVSASHFAPNRGSCVFCVLICPFCPLWSLSATCWLCQSLSRRKPVFLLNTRPKTPHSSMCCALPHRPLSSCMMRHSHIWTKVRRYGRTQDWFDCAFKSKPDVYLCLLCLSVLWEGSGCLVQLCWAFTHLKLLAFRICCHRQPRPSQSCDLPPRPHFTSFPFRPVLRGANVGQQEARGVTRAQQQDGEGQTGLRTRRQKTLFWLLTSHPLYS